MTPITTPTTKATISSTGRPFGRAWDSSLGAEAAVSSLDTKEILHARAPRLLTGWVDSVGYRGASAQRFISDSNA